MLQQTQVSRVLIKFPQFITQFPDVKTLAHASLPNILRSWQGLGYNRRALYLHRIAKEVVQNHKGLLPLDIGALESLPGIGHATACSIYVFSTNKPAVFIETNIRRVFIHHFFQDKIDVHDKELLPFIEETLDERNPRDWYYALMDYGSYLAKQTINPNRKSRHYAKQSKFEGSDRQIRGQILKLLLEKKSLTRLNTDPERLQKVLNSLLKDGLIKKSRKTHIIS